MYLGKFYIKNFIQKDLWNCRTIIYGIRTIGHKFKPKKNSKCQKIVSFSYHFLPKLNHLYPNSKWIPLFMGNIIP